MQVDTPDQLGADVARKVEVDVGRGGQLLVEEAPERQPPGDRIDVREARQVADDRADARATAATGRQHVARRIGTAQLAGHDPGQLQNFLVKQEEAGQPVTPDQGQLGVESLVGLVPPGRAGGITRRQLRLAELLQGAVGIGGALGWPVAEAGSQVEATALCDAQGLAERLGQVGEQLLHLGRRLQHVLTVAAQERRAGIERGVLADRHEDVLQRATTAQVKVHVVGGHDRQPALRGQPGEGAQLCLGPLPEGALQLDGEASAEGLQQLIAPAARHDGIVGPQDAVVRTARQAGQPLGSLQHRGERDARWTGNRAVGRTGAGVRRCDQPAEVRVARAALDEEEQVAQLVVDGDRQLAACDRLQPCGRGRVGEGQRRAEVVVVRQRQRVVPQRDGAVDQLLRLRHTVEERVGRVAVQLDVISRHTATSRPCGDPGRPCRDARRRARVRSSGVGAACSTSPPRCATPRAPRRPGSRQGCPAGHRPRARPDSAVASGRRAPVGPDSSRGQPVASLGQPTRGIDAHDAQQRALADRCPHLLRRALQPLRPLLACPLEQG